MSRKTLWMLAGVLAVLVAALWWSNRGTPGAGGTAGEASPRLLPGVELNSLRAIVIADGAVTARLARVDGGWTVSDPDGYPADLTRLRDLIRAIDEADAGQLADAGADRLSEYGLAADDLPPPLRIELEHAAGTTVLRLGKVREPRSREDLWGPPAGRFARVDEGPVRLLKEDIRLAQADPSLWWDRTLLEVAPETIRKVEVSGPEGSFAMERDTNGVYVLAGATPEETVDTAAADRLFGALRNLQADRILTAPAEGAADPFANAIQSRAEVDGGTYTLQIGAAAEDGSGRPVKIEAAAAADAAPERQAEFAAVAKKLAGRTYQVPAYLAESLTLKRENVTRPVPPPAPETPVEATATPVVESSEPPTVAAPESPAPETIPESPVETTPPPVPVEDAPAAEP